MQYVAEPGIILDVLDYNMVFFNPSIMKLRDKIFAEGFESSYYYYDQLRAGKQKFEPYSHWLPFFRYKSSYCNYYPLYKFFWDKFDMTLLMDDFLNLMKTEEFKRCCFENTLGKYSGEINLDDVFRGDLSECLRAAALLSRDGEDVMTYVPYLTCFDKLIDEITPYLRALYQRMTAFHAQIIPTLITNLENLFAGSENKIRLMHNIDKDVTISGQFYTGCLMEHLVLSCRKIGENRLIFFTGASGKNSLKLLEETLGVNLLSFGEEFGSEIKYEIVQTLRKGERTVSQIAKMLYTSRSTVERGAVALQKAHVLSVSKHIGVETYYKLNPHYFVAAKTKLRKDIDDILEDIIVGANLI
jgi:hypothetical protein